MKETAARLFIRRNSLVYRLGRIREIGKADIDGSDTLFLFRLSFGIGRHAGLGV